MNFKKFQEPIYVTRPFLPNLEEVNVLLQDIWEEQILTNGGPKHQELEKALCDTLKVQGLSLFNNGTIALIIACQALGLKGEVITTPFTFPATPHVLTWNNIKPVFCDIDPLTMNIDTSKIESLITPETSAILGVHVYGTPCNVFEIERIAKKHGLKVIYDAAHAFGVEIDGRGIGTFGDISMFSFHATKLFHTVEGGCLAYNNRDLKSYIDLLKNFGIKNEDEVILPGINGKLNEIQAAIGLINLKHLEEERKRRAALIHLYKTRLAEVEGVSFIDLPSNIVPSYQYFVIRVSEKNFGMSRDELHLKLKEYNVITRKYFKPLCSDYQCYQHLPSATQERLPVAYSVVNEVLALPLYGTLALEDVEIICELIHSLTTRPSVHSNKSCSNSKVLK